MNIVFEGLLLGLAYAMPIGPQNVFVINSAFTEGLPKSFRTSFVVSFFDIALAIACLYGVGFLIEAFPIIRGILLISGSVFLFFIGYKLFRAKVINLEETNTNNHLSILKVIQYCFVLTWLNPQALIDGSLLFGGIRSTMSQESVPLFIAGIVLASPLWFFSLTGIVGGLRTRLPKNFFKLVNYICGSVLVLYGAKLLYYFIQFNTQGQS